MAMIPLKCPSCSADITLDDSKEFGFCQYCGTRIQNDAIKKLKVEYSGDPMSVMSVYDNGTTVNRILRICCTAKGKYIADTKKAYGSFRSHMPSFLQNTMTFLWITL